MFQKWGFLLTEVWLLLALAALLGLFVGWLIWGRSAQAVVDTSETDRLRAALASCSDKGKDLAARLSTAEAEAKSANARASAATELAARAEDSANAAKLSAAAANAASPAPMAAQAAPVMSAPKPAAAAKPAKASPPKAEAAPATEQPKVENAAPAKPKGLTAARDGKADDLKMIKGIGPALEKLCHSLGFYHFDQLAGWTATEIAWVDDNLEGFKGRVTRDEWVIQAKLLAKGSTTEFSKRVEKGDVY